MTKQVKLIEKFLTDLVAVNGLKEQDLKGLVDVITVPSDFLIIVKGADVDFGVRLRPAVENGKFVETNEVFGCSDKYPDTYKAIKDYGCKQIEPI